MFKRFQWRATSRSSLGFALAIAATATAAPLVSSTPASAAGSFSMVVTASPTALYGSPSTVTIVVTNTGTVPEYNLTYRDILPPGITAVPGSVRPVGVGDPQLIANAPVAGQSTIILPNAADLQPGASFTISYQLQAVTGAPAATYNLLPGNTYHDQPTAYVDSDPRYVPKFDALGNFIPTPSSTAITPPAPAPTLITPVQITKQEPNPEAKIMRGVHAHATLYTMVVTNNKVGATNHAVVDDWLPAGLEFLGCGGVDNTTDASGTNPGSALEYPGASHLGAGLSSDANCSDPTLVETVMTTPPGQPTGVYTHVQWTIGDLAPSSTTTLTYYAAVPLRENTTTWSAGVPPTTGAQASNLDNNNGAYTRDGEALTNVAKVSGDYQGDLAPGVSNPVYAIGNHTVVAKDLAVTKSVSTTNFVSGQRFTYSLLIRTSEYAYVPGSSITDTIPNGVCPIDSVKNYTGKFIVDPNCDPVAGTDPVLVDHTTSHSYTLGQSTPYFWNITNNNDATFTATWNLPTLPLPASGSPATPSTLAPNSNATLTFSAMDRLAYGHPVGASAPTVAGDSVTNNVAITGPATTTCVNTSGATPVLDPTCGTGSHPITVNAPSQPSSPVTVNDTSSATQSAALPIIIKKVADPVTSPSPYSCATAAYVKAPVPPYPAYQKGDKICFQLAVTFPNGLQTRDATITDYLPPNTTYVAGSLVAAAGNDAVFSADTSTAAQGYLGINVGTLATDGHRYVPANATLLVNLAVIATADPSAGNNYDLTANLMKMVFSTSDSQTISLRDQASYTLSRPILALAKGVAKVTRATTIVQGPFSPPQDNVAVQGGDQVTYQLDLTNTGLSDAFSTTVWDRLPVQITSCSQVSAVSNGGSCTQSGAASPIVVWPSSTAISVPAATNATPSVPGVTSLTYVVTVPTAVGPGETLSNHAGVVSYASSDNQQGSTLEIPQNNIDPVSNPPATWNSPPADDTSSIYTPAATFGKAAAPTLNGPSSATIGEPIVYTLTATVPAGSTIYSGSMTDALGALSGNPPARLKYDGGPVTVKLGATTNPPGFTATGSTATNSISVVFPPTVSAPSSGPVTITATFTAIVTDVAANVAGAALTNIATESFKNSQGTTTTLSASATSTVVEPNLGLTKTDAPGGPYTPGSTITYSITATNSSSRGNVSSAYGLAIVDTVPKGLTVIAASITAPGVLTHNASTGIDTINWTYPSSGLLAVNAQRVVSFQATIPDPIVANSRFTNNAVGTVASLDTALYPDARTAGGYYRAPATNNALVLSPTITKTASPSSVTIGVDTTYTATVTIPPKVQLPNFTVFDTLPNGMTFGQIVSATTTNTALPSCSQGLVNTAMTNVAVTGGGTRIAWWVGNLIECPLVRTLTYVYTAHPAKSYANGTAVKSGDVLTNSATTAWNDTDQYSGQVPSTQPALSSYVHQGTPGTAPVTVIEPLLAITKAASTTTPTPGVPFTYTITVKNNGTSPAFDATLNDPIPAGLIAPTAVGTPTGANAGTASYVASSNSIVWNIVGPIAPGASVALTFTTMLTTSDQLTNNQSITNTATIKNYYGVPASTATASPTRYVTYGPVAGSVVVKATFPALAITKSMPNGPNAQVGTPFTWKLVLTNSTVAPASNVSIVDTLPPNWTYQAGSTVITLASSATSTADPTISTTANVSTLTWAVPGGLAKGQSITVVFQATPGAGAPNLSTNAVKATCSDATGATGNKSGPYQSNVAQQTAIVAIADLVITKSVAGSGSLTAGGSANAYALSVRNNGPSQAEGPIVVNDNAPSGTTFTSASGSGWLCTLGASGGSIHCATPGPLANGATLPVITVGISIPADYPVTGSPATGSITNTATVTGPTYDPDLSNNTSTITSSVTPSADLAITKVHNGPVVAGSTLTYNVDVTNLGPSDSPVPGTPIAVTDTLPAGMTYVSASGAGWTCPTTVTGQVFTCTYGDGLPVGTDVSLSIEATIDASVTSGTTLTNSATISTTTVPDPNLSNNTATDPAVVTTSADLAINKIHDPTSKFRPGVTGDGTYILTVQNFGPSAAVNPVVTDTLPSTLTFESWGTLAPEWTCTHGAGSQRVFCIHNGPILPGATVAPITFSVTVDPTVGIPDSIANSASVSSTTHDPDPLNNTSTDMVGSGDREVDLGITKTHVGTFTAGGDGVFTMTVTNHGTAAIRAGIDGMIIGDILPLGMTWVSGTGTGWTCEDAPASVAPVNVVCISFDALAVGASTTVTLTVHVASNVSDQVLTNVALVESQAPDPNLDNNVAEDPVQVVTSADLSITKSHTGTFTPGTNDTYTLAVHNAGPSDAASPVIVNDTLPAGETYVSGTGTNWSCSAAGQDVTCTLSGSLVAGTDAAPITLTVAIDAGYLGTTLINTATVDSPTTDPNPTNNSSTDTVTGVTALADITISKSHLGTFTAGEQGSFTVSVANLGPSDNQGPLTVTDPMPAGLTAVSATGTNWNCQVDFNANVVTCVLPSGLLTGASAPPITIGVTVDAATTDASVVNTVHVDPGTTTDPVPANNTASDTVTLATSADLSIVKRHTGSIDLSATTPFTYTLAVHNAGPSDAASPVTVTDTLPTGLTYVAATGAFWTCDATGQLVTCTLGGPLPALTSAPPISLQVTPDAAAYPDVTNTAHVQSPTTDPVPTNNTSSDPTVVDPYVDLSIIKTHRGNPVAGVPLIYDLTVSNAGPTPDPGPVVVTDDLPSQLSYVSATGTNWTCGAAGQLVTCTYSGAFNVGETSAIVLTVIPSEAASIVNTASVTSHAKEHNPHDNTHSDPAIIVPGARVTVTKTLLSPTPLVTGGTASYQVTVTNHGPSPAENVSITDAIPAGLSATAASGPGWNCTVTASLVTCIHPAPMAANTASSVRIDTIVTATSGTVANSVVVNTTTKPVTPGKPTATTPEAPVENHNLPFTGFDFEGDLALGAAFVAAGLALVTLGRRRRR